MHIKNLIALAEAFYSGLQANPAPGAIVSPLDDARRTQHDERVRAVVSALHADCINERVIARFSEILAAARGARMTPVAAATEVHPDTARADAAEARVKELEDRPGVNEVHEDAVIEIIPTAEPTREPSTPIDFQDWDSDTPYWSDMIVSESKVGDLPTVAQFLDQNSKKALRAIVEATPGVEAPANASKTELAEALANAPKSVDAEAVAG